MLSPGSAWSVQRGLGCSSPSGDAWAVCLEGRGLRVCPAKSGPEIHRHSPVGSGTQARPWLCGSRPWGFGPRKPGGLTCKRGCCCLTPGVGVRPETVEALSGLPGMRRHRLLGCPGLCCLRSVNNWEPSTPCAEHLPGPVVSNVLLPTRTLSYSLLFVQGTNLLQNTQKWQLSRCGKAFTFPWPPRQPSL